jgi:hypothetical protein
MPELTAYRFPELSEIPEAAAPGVPVHVIAAAIEAGLVRGIAHFTSPAIILREVRTSVGMLTEVSDWSAACYHLPTYLGLDGWKVDGGIFLFPWTDDTAADWRNPRRRITERTGRLLRVPCGWVNHSTEARP